MRDINYRINPIFIGSKVRPITLYSPEASARQKELYSKYRETFSSATHRAVYSYIPGRSNYEIARGFSAYYRKSEHLPQCAESTEFLSKLTENTNSTYRRTSKKPKISYLRCKIGARMFAVAERLCGDCV